MEDGWRMQSVGNVECGIQMRKVACDERVRQQEDIFSCLFSESIKRMNESSSKEQSH
jgi:hypothetical protein